MKQFTFLFLVLFVSTTFSINSPKPGQKMPDHVKAFYEMVQKSYGEGYFAKKFEERRIIREKISQGLLPKNALITDTVFALTLLGKYADSNPRYTREQFQQKLFDGPNPTGTITDYYREVSYNQLYFTGYCSNWYQVPGTMASYVGSDNGLSANGGPKFTLDLIKAADSTLDFSKFIQYYDSQGNPRIGFIAVVHTGAGAEAGAQNIWSHRWNFRMLTGGQPYRTNDIDSTTGKYVLIDGDYAIQPELEGNNNQIGNLVEIGVFTHEFGHIFGLPDLYDTDNSSEGLGNWCLMAGGSWGGNGNTPETPVHMSAWCKKQLGWLTPIDVGSYNPNLVIPNSEQNPVVYRMWRMGPIGVEYFLLENRQKIGFDKNLYIGGLLIFHVDDSRPNNRDENHYKVGLVQADGLWDLNRGRNRGDAGDPYPGSTNNTRFDAASNPNSNDYNNSPTYVSVRNIRIDGQNVIATLDIGTQPYVIAREVKLLEAVQLQNGRIEQNEYATANLKLYNVEQISSSSSNIQFFVNEEGIQLLKSGISVPVNGLTEVNLSIDSLFFVQNNFESRYIYIKYNVSSNDNVFSDSIKVLIGIPRILLYSKGDKPALSNYYFAALNSLNKKFEFVENDTPKYFYGRDIVIVYSGKNKDSLFENSFIDSLKMFIDNGGKLFMSGQNIAEFLNSANQDFLHTYIGVNYLKNASIFANKIYGKSGDLFGKDISSLRINGTEGAANETSMDIFESLGNFNVSLAFKTDGSDATGGWRVYPSGAKLFYLGFGFESINDSLSTITRNELFSKVYNWFMGFTSVPFEDDLSLKKFELYQNYPNPFNAKTKITFFLPEKSKITLKLYNSIGELVGTLINDEFESGTHIINFDGGNLSSGIYFYKIETNTQTITRKMVLLK